MGFVALLRIEPDVGLGRRASQPIRAFPRNASIAYDLCLVDGDTVPGGLAKSVAASGGTYRCAVK